MKNRITLLLSVLVLASCSAPKYTYFFSHENHKVASKQSPASTRVQPLFVDAEMLVASTETGPVLFSEKTASVGKTYLQMDRGERKMLRHQLKKDIKSYLAVKKSNSIKSVQASGGMDHDLKLAAIFGAVGIVGLLIGGNVFNIIGGIMLLIGVVFFVKWIIRQ